MRVSASITTFVLLTAPSLAQIGGGTTATGQVHLPNGQPARQEIRLHVQLESGRRGPYLVYTDTMGRFELRDLRTLVTYRITVESDDQNWATTTVSFIPSGLNPRLNIFLQPLRKDPGTSGPGTVSANALQQRVPPEASKEFEKAVKLIRKNDYASAQPLLERAVEIYPSYIDARNELAVTLMRENKLDAAETHLRVALEVDPVAVRPLMNLGLCLSRQQRFQDALLVLEKAVQLTAGEPSGHLLLGVALLKTGKYDEAEVALRKAYELGGKSVAQAQYYLAEVYIQQHDFARAISALEIYLRDNPGDPNSPQLRKHIERLRAAQAKP